jgi:hypothetical protein
VVKLSHAATRHSKSHTTTPRFVVSTSIVAIDISNGELWINKPFKEGCTYVVSYFGWVGVFAFVARNISHHCQPVYSCYSSSKVSSMWRSHSVELNR